MGKKQEGEQKRRSQAVWAPQAEIGFRGLDRSIDMLLQDSFKTTDSCIVAVFLAHVSTEYGIIILPQ